MSKDTYMLPVHPEKVKLIQDMLQDPKVNELYEKWVSLAWNNKTAFQFDLNVKARNDAFERYCAARDKFLGLPPIKITATRTMERVS